MDGIELRKPALESVRNTVRDLAWVSTTDSIMYSVRLFIWDSVWDSLNSSIWLAEGLIIGKIQRTANED